MKKVISKRDGKEYFKTVASFEKSTGYNDFSFIKNERYWVRKVDASDNVDPEKFVIVKGNFFSDIDNLKVMFSYDPVTKSNGYHGTYTFGIPVTKEDVKLVLEYVD